MIKIKAKMTFKASLNGYSVSTFEKGVVYEVSDVLGKNLIESNRATQSTVKIIKAIEKTENKVISNTETKTDSSKQEFTEKEFLKNKAKELGLKPHPFLGTEKLKKMIEDAETKESEKKEMIEDASK